MIQPGDRVLHFAPERGIYDRLIERLGAERYTVADLNPDRYAWADRVIKLDMTDLDALPSMTYDYIVHSHVLEHVPCNEAYTFYHLHRALKEDGRHVFVIPIKGSEFYSSAYSGLDREERERCFGQWDHVRVFGLKDLDLSLGKIVDLPVAYDALNDFSEDDLREIGLLERYWKRLSVNSVINLGRYDMKLLKQREI